MAGPFNIIVRGDKRIARFGKKLSKADKPALREAAAEITKLKREIIKETINKTKLNKQTGNLFRDLQVSGRRKAVISKDGIETSIGSDLVYAGIQETGGTIVAKGGKLTVPLVPSSELAGRRARDIPGLFKITSKAGNLILATKGPSPGTLKPWFVLKDQVTIPPRLGLFKTARDVIKRQGSGLVKRMRLVLEKNFRR